MTKIFAKFSHDAPLPMVKKKHLSIEQLNARRRKVWLTIAKKEIPKVSFPKAEEELLEIPAGLLLRNVDSDLLQSLVLMILFISILQSFKQKTSAKNLVLTNAKKVKSFTLFHTRSVRIAQSSLIGLEKKNFMYTSLTLCFFFPQLAHQCMREVRRAAIQAQKNCKETLPRARRLTKEMMLYWKKYDKVEKEHRKRAEKEALEQRKLDEEMREVGGLKVAVFVFKGASLLFISLTRKG